MKTEPIRWRLELEAEARRVAAMETQAMLSDLNEAELEEFCSDFVARPWPTSNLPKLGGAYEAARAIADERREKLSRLRSAFDFRDTKAALDIARELCGVKDDEKSNRTHPRIN